MNAAVRDAAASAMPVDNGRSRFGYASSLVTISEPASISAESVRAVRTHVVAQHVNAGRRALAVCAPSVDSGCTFLAVNLAVALAQIGLKVLLIDGDLQQSTLAEYIRPECPVSGLGDFLSRPDARIGDFIETDVLPNLSLMFAGPPVLNAQELLATQRFADGVNVCLRNYDLTIIDTPPANTSSDVRRIGSVAGYALMVARRHRTLVPDLKALCKELEADNATVIGTVLYD